MNKRPVVLVVLLIPNIINEIINNESISEDEATTLFYESNLYNILEDYETDLWHLSPKALYELYKQEKETGKIVYPREQ